MAFKTMPKETVLRLLEDTEDTVSEPLSDLMSEIKSTRCPSCNLPLVPKPDLEVPFNPDSHIPRFHGQCTQCGLVMDVHTGDIHTYPTKRDVLE